MAPRHDLTFATLYKLAAIARGEGEGDAYLLTESERAGLWDMFALLLPSRPSREQAHNAANLWWDHNRAKLQALARREHQAN